MPSIQPGPRTPTPAEAIKDPSEQFASPQEVVRNDSLSKNDKRRILTSWAKDAELLAQAEAENMSGGEHARLREVKLALAALDDDPQS